MDDDVKKLIRFSGPLNKAIEDYAERQGITFTEAVRDMCAAFLNQEYERNFAPLLAKMLNRNNDKLLRQMNLLLEQHLEDYLPRREL